MMEQQRHGEGMVMVVMLQMLTSRTLQISVAVNMPALLEEMMEQQWHGDTRMIGVVVMLQVLTSRMVVVMLQVLTSRMLQISVAVVMPVLLEEMMEQQWHGEPTFLVVMLDQMSLRTLQISVAVIMHALLEEMMEQQWHGDGIVMVVML
jgi:hypothetical protein